MDFKAASSGTIVAETSSKPANPLKETFR